MASPARPLTLVGYVSVQRNPAPLHAGAERERARSGARRSQATPGCAMEATARLSMRSGVLVPSTKNAVEPARPQPARRPTPSPTSLTRANPGEQHPSARTGGRERKHARHHHPLRGHGREDRRGGAEGPAGVRPDAEGQPGFQGYAAFASEQGDIIACTIWESAAAAANSRDDVRGWVRRNLPGFMEPTERFSGPVGPHAIVSPQSGGPGQSLHCMVRKAENLPPPKSSGRSSRRCWPPSARSPASAAPTGCARRTTRPAGLPSCSATPGARRRRARGGAGRHARAPAERRRPRRGLGDDLRLAMA
jgi:hypothetical protein